MCVTMTFINIYVLSLCLFFIQIECANKRHDYLKVLCQVNCINTEKIIEINFHDNTCMENCSNVELNMKDEKLPPNSGFPKPVLHCRTEEDLSVKWTTWGMSTLYFLEIRPRKSEWISVAMTTRANFTFHNLTSGDEYQIRIWGIRGETEIIGSSFSPWLRTLNSEFIPKPVSDISIQKLELKRNFYEAIVQWTPNKEDMTCFYDLVWFGGNGNADYSQKEFKESTERFEIRIGELEFNSNYSVDVMAKSADWERESLRRKIHFSTPSCLEAHGNLTICSPAQPMNLTTNEVLVKAMSHDGIQTTIYDVTVAWNTPKYVPDYYIVLLKCYNSVTFKNFTEINMTISGTHNQAKFNKVDVGLHYHVFVTAYSTGGRSESALLYRQMNHTEVPSQYRYTWVLTILGITTLIILALVDTAYFIFHRRAKRKRYERRCKYFEELEEKQPKNMGGITITSETGLVLEDPLQEWDQWELNPERLVMKSILGEGAFGLVRRAWLRDDKSNSNTEVAVKMLKDTSSQEQMRHFMHEIDIMKTVGSHPHLVSILGCCTRIQQSERVLLLVVEYCALGDLQNYLRGAWDRMTSPPEHKIQYADLVSESDSRGSVNLIINKLYDLENSMSDESNLQPSDLLSFSRQIALGMEFLSNLKVLHRDLAARNVLVCADKSVKIADFGLSRDVYRDNMYRKLGNGKLPIRWMAIESLTHQIYTTQSDVWSFGILLWEIVTLGGNPYPSIPTNALLKLLKSGYRMERPLNCGPELYSIMLSCWKVRPKDRPSFTQLSKSLDILLGSVTTSKYLDLDVLTSTEFASFRVSVKDTSSITLKSKSKSRCETISSERYVHPVLLNNAKNADLSAIMIK